MRAWKQNASGRNYFLYDGIVPVVEMDSSGSVSATNTFGATGLISRRTGSTSVFYSFDSEGNVAQRSDGTGVVLSNHLFSAHGSLLSGTFVDPFGYKAQFGYYTATQAMDCAPGSRMRADETIFFTTGSCRLLKWIRAVRFQPRILSAPAALSLDGREAQVFSTASTRREM